MDIMFIFLLQRKTNCVGSFTAVRTLSATCSILGAQNMCVKKRAWTVTVLTLAFINILRMGVHCPGGSGEDDLNHLRWTIVDFIT